jgi:2-amino-4-hydroxy-6-hydroxymethyldihydropteridine diphosphokinase
MPLVYWSLGSNLGDRDGFLAAGRKALREKFKQARFSSVYETEPVDVTDQPWFLNQVAEVVSDQGPESLLEWAQSVEASEQRQREVPKGPRTLDLDLLLVGELIRQDKDPLVPHPRLTQRRHVLVPLAELSPDLRIPGLDLTVAQALSRVQDYTQVRFHAEP